jgi:glycosyltransferase involved in cell wall biosynthesis
VWPPLASAGLAPRRWFVPTWPGFHASAPRIARELVSGDVIIAIKPRLHSFGLALAARRVRPRPLLLDVDDWELGFFNAWADAALAPLSWISAASNLHTRWYFTRAARADAVTVSTRWLQQRFGGSLIPHARPEMRAPGPLSPEPLVMFAGTPRPHKGLSDLVLAFRQVQARGAELHLIGAAGDRELARLAAADRRVRLEPAVPLEQLPERLARAWVIAIPQRDEAASRAQLPAKLMDAMALGKAIVSTAVGELPSWLSDDAGVIVPPRDPRALGAALERLLGDAALRRHLGERARARFLQLASEHAVRPRLEAVIEQLLARAPTAAGAAPDQAADRPAAAM